MSRTSLVDPCEVAIGWTTVETVVDAEGLAQTLLEARLAACVQVDSGVKSFYVWKGKVARENEVRIWIKTTVACAEKIEGFFKLHHPYDTPQWVWVRVDGGAEAYLDWVRESV